MSLTVPNNIMNGQAIDAVPVMQNFNALGAIAPAGGVVAAAAGANADITSLGGLSLALTKNRLRNAEFRVDQRNNSGSTNSTSGTFVFDGWSILNNNTNRVSGTKTTNGPPDSVQGFRQITTTAGTPSGADAYAQFQNLEGYSVSDFAFGTASASNIVISFWAVSSIAGTYALAVRNGGAARSYVTPFTISVANVLQFFSIVIPGDTAGTWFNDFQQGLQLSFCSACGSTYSTATQNTWQNGNFIALNSQTQLCTTLNATLDIFKVQLERGSVATPFDFVPYPKTLVDGRRYYTAGSGTLSQYSPTSGVTLYFVIPFAISMRPTPPVATPVVSGGSGYSSASVLGTTTESFILGVISNAVQVVAFNYTYTCASEV